MDMNYRSVIQKYTIISCIFLFSIKLSSAQWSIGPLLDLNFATSNLNTGSDGIGTRALLGIGLVTDHNINENLSIRLEPMYLLKGWRHKELNQKYSASYIEIPALVKYSLEIDQNLTPYLLAGPSFGILLNGNIKFEDGDTADRTDSFKKVDLGFGLGAGVECSVSNYKVFAELRYSIGVIDVNDVETIETKFRNRGLNIVLGTLFNFTKN